MSYFPFYNRERPHQSLPANAVGSLPCQEKKRGRDSLEQRGEGHHDREGRRRPRGRRLPWALFRFGIGRYAPDPLALHKAQAGGKCTKPCKSDIGLSYHKEPLFSVQQMGPPHIRFAR